MYAGVLGKLLAGAMSSNSFEMEVSHSNSERERKWFCHMSKFLDGSPRRLKRILNIYGIQRFVVTHMPGGSVEHDLEKEAVNLNEREIILLEKLVRWVVLVEQWPSHIAFVIKYVDHCKHRREIQARLSEMEGKLTTGGSTADSTSTPAAVSSMPISEQVTVDVKDSDKLLPLYRSWVRPYVHTSSATTSGVQSGRSTDFFELLLGDKLANGESLTVEDMEELRNFNFNMNPALEEQAIRHIEGSVLIQHVSADQQSMELQVRCL